VDKNITGKVAEARLGEAHITVNKNAVPNDPKSPFITSGLRLGSPAGTTRGFGVNEFKQIAHWIADIIDDIENQEVINNVKLAVTELCHRFPVYKD
jgi:glycine hydroxymethyltransferase